MSEKSVSIGAEPATERPEGAAAGGGAEPGQATSDAGSGGASKATPRKKTGGKAGAGKKARKKAKRPAAKKSRKRTPGKSRGAKSSKPAAARKRRKKAPAKDRPEDEAPPAASPAPTDEVRPEPAALGAASERRSEAEADAAVEPEPQPLSPEEALAFLSELSSAASDAGGPGARESLESEGAGPAAGGGAHGPRRSRRRVLPSVMSASCRVLTFEAAHTEPGMRVAGSTLARIYGLVRDSGLDVSLGPICQDMAHFVAEWDNTPPGMPVAVVANLSGARTFLGEIVSIRPRIASAYWIVFETLRSEVTTATIEFLAELRSTNRLRAIGFGPRNIVEAARNGTEALRGHVLWGFGRKQVARAG